MEREARSTLMPNQSLLESWRGECQLDPLLVTILCVAEWADRYAIWPLVGDGTVGYEAGLPADPGTRHELLVSAWDDVRAYLDREYPGYRLIAAMLWAGDQVVLNNHDATWASYSELHLSPGQIEALQECWSRHGIPPDLYVRGQSIADRGTQV
jgi:hypothetical protein